MNQPHRLWLNRILGTSDDEEEGMLIDTYRTLNPDKKFAYTCWNTKISKFMGIWYAPSFMARCYGALLNVVSGA